MEIADFVRQGLPLSDILLVDMHCHLGQGRDFNIPFPNTHEQFLHFCQTLDRVGVDYACVSMLRALYLSEPEANYELQALMEQDSRILGWAVYSPLAVQASLASIFRCREASSRYVGVKLHPDFHQTKITDDAYRPVFEYADSEGLPLLIHTWQGPFSDPFLLEGLVAGYPRAKFLLAHCGGMQPSINEAMRLAREYDNVYLDLNGGFIYSGMRLEDYTGRVSTEKLLFSSDTVFNNICWEIGNVAFSGVPETAKRAILGANANKLLQLGRIAEKL